ncbi:hypothetical protein [Duganella hordei]|uniref:hypothetical protein n=1 Tax=Duganella hordei TaxID=2865934 RepID=UPI0030EAC6BD
MEQISPLQEDANTPLLRFSITEDQVNNEFLRQGPVAAHLLQTSGAAPRLLVAFPAGNSAVGLWCVPGTPLQWSSPQLMRAVRGVDAKGRALFGIETEFDVDGAELTIEAAVLSSARVLRVYQFNARLPAGVNNQVAFGADHVDWSRQRLDGQPGYALTLQALGGRVDTDRCGRISFHAAPGERLRLRLVALCGEPPLRPMSLQRLLRQPEALPLRALQSLAFLSYEDKLLAGSWRFNTYFGRDTLMALLLLMPALTAEAVESGLAAVLARLSEHGDVAHEEDIGEWAILHGGAGAVYDYKMVDDDFMLAPVMAAYLLGQPEGHARAAAFLAHAPHAGPSHGTALARNLHHVLRGAAAFARRPAIDTLIHLKPGQQTGDWRDSADGLGGGTISYNVNAVLVPAALRAIDALFKSGLLAPYMAGAGGAAELAQVWEERVPALFHVSRSAEQARQAVRGHAAETAIAPAAALASLPDAALAFHAIALDDAGQPIAVMHSDLGFALMLQEPPAAMIERELSAIMRPFPAGLMTSVGMLVANAAYADAVLRPLFGPDRYHGAVVWSWQQALLAAGLARQRRRHDLPASTHAVLAGAEAILWPTIHATQALGSTELWAWGWRDGACHMKAFRSDSAGADESNAAQLWSTVYLAVKPPGADASAVHASAGD